MPGVCPKTLTIPGQGSVAIAIVGADSLDVTQIVAGSLRLTGNVAPTQTNYLDVSTATGRMNKTEVDCNVAGADLQNDLVVLFTNADVVASMTATLGHAPSNGEVVTLEITGSFQNGSTLRGRASVRVLSGN
jgi:hypothetical protein